MTINPITFTILNKSVMYIIQQIVTSKGKSYPTFFVKELGKGLIEMTMKSDEAHQYEFHTEAHREKRRLFQGQSNAKVIPAPKEAKADEEGPECPWCGSHSHPINTDISVANFQHGSSSDPNHVARNPAMCPDCYGVGGWIDFNVDR